MALKAVMLRSKIDKKKAELAELLAKDAEFASREAELETAISEAETDGDQQAVEDQIEAFDGEKEEHEQAKEDLSQMISDLEEELAEEEKKTPAPEDRTGRKERGMSVNINIRALPKTQRVFDALTMDQKRAIVENSEVKAFLERMRQMKGQNRAVTGAELSIPVEMLPLISENLFRYSKLLNRVNVQQVGGETRQTIAGTIPEAVWTEMCGALNELTFEFNQVMLDGYKVAGFVPICNSILEDNDINLAAWIVEALSEAVGLAIDKAILYGKGSASRMPLGIVTRLAQTAKPADYPATAPEWVDLHTSNVIKINGDSMTGVEFWAALMEATGNTYTRYSRGTQFWAMNSKTYAKLRAKLITFTGTGDIVANLYGSLPIITGDVDVLEFMPDGDIVGGYGQLYVLAQRSGMTIESDSSGIFFIQDNTVFRGKQRMDGQPIIPGAFVAININNTEVTTVMDFAADNANDAQLTALAVGSQNLTPAFGSTTYAYTLAASAATAKIEATAAQAGAEIAINYNGDNVRNGGTVTWLADGTAHPLTVTVRNGNAVRVYTVQVTRTGG